MVINMAREPEGYFGNTTANGDIIEAVLVNTHYAYYTNYYDIETYHCNKMPVRAQYDFCLYQICQQPG